MFYGIQTNPIYNIPIEPLLRPVKRISDYLLNMAEIIGKNII